MWPFKAIMWLHERDRRHTRAEEQPQPGHRAGRNGRAGHGHPPRQASGEDRVYDEIAGDGGADRGRNGKARKWLPKPAEETDQAPRFRQDRGRVRLRRPSLSLYLDTSALIKLLIDEPDCDIAREAYRRAH